MSPLNSVDLRPWEPVIENRDDSVTARSAAALHGLLDSKNPLPGCADPLPPLWHWLAFLPTASQKQLGSDGHPELGDFMPPIGLPRRMFAGGRIEIKAPVAIGQTFHRQSTVTSVKEKFGHSGNLIFVEVTNEFSADGRSTMTEIQNLVYRSNEIIEGEGGNVSRVLALDNEDYDHTWDWRGELETGPTLLFRFSALTYNAHRIHYDLVYATEMEGYPSLVVHGPLQVLALGELSREHVGDRHVMSVEFRARRPVFSGAPMQLRGRQVDDDHVDLIALNEAGQPTMAVNVALHPRHR